MAEALPLSEDDAGQSVSLADKLRLAASKGLLDKVTELLQSGASFEPDREGRTAIHYAAVHGYTDICKLLLDHGCDVDARDNLGYTPLHRAAAQGHVETVKLIVDEGCAIDRQDEVHGNTGLHEAAWNGFSQTITFLIKNKSNVYVTNKAGFTALHLSAQNGHNESARILLYAGCSPDLKNNYGDTALHTASRYGHAGVARILISAQCSISEQNKNGDTALHIAAALKRRKISKVLMESGIDPNIKNKQNETATDVARRKEHPEVIIIISKTLPKPIKKHLHHSTRDVGDGAAGKKPQAEPGGKESGKEKKGLFPWMKKKDKDKKLFSPDNNPTEEVVPGRHHRSKHGHQGMFGQYVKKQGMQYYRDLAGNIRQGPVGYMPLCQCQPALTKLEQRVEADRHNFYDHVDATQQQLTQRIDNLERRTTQQIYSIDRLNQERLDAEKHDCHERVERRAMQERLETDRQLELAQAKVQDELQRWMQLREGKTRGTATVAKRDETFGATPSNFNRDVFENNSFRHKKGNRRFAWASRLIRSRSDETLSHSEYSFHGKAYQSRKNAIEQLRALKLSTVNKQSKNESVGISRPNPVGQLTRPRTMHEEMARFNVYEPLKALSEQSADSKSTPDMSGNFSQRRNPIDVRLLREFEDSELESRAKPHDSSVIKQDSEQTTPKQLDFVTPKQTAVSTSFKQIVVPPSFTSTPASHADTVVNRVQLLPSQSSAQPPPYGYNGPPKPPYSYAWKSVRKPAICPANSNSSSNYAELSGLQSTSPSLIGSSAAQSPQYSGADSPGQKTESGSNPDSGYSSKIYGVRLAPSYPAGQVQSPLVDSSLNSSANDSTNLPSYQNSPDNSYEFIKLHSSVNDSTVSRSSSNYANVSAELEKSLPTAEAAKHRDYNDYANVSCDPQAPARSSNYVNVVHDSPKPYNNYANVPSHPSLDRSDGNYVNSPGERLTASRQYNHPTQEIEQWYQRHRQPADSPQRFREVVSSPQPNENAHRFREVSQPPQLVEPLPRYRELSQPPPVSEVPQRFRRIPVPPQGSAAQRRYREVPKRPEPRISHSTDV